MITRKQLIKKYLEFFKKKGHKEIPSASLIPENDPSVLFTTAGMHPLVPYLLGEKHPLGKKLVGVQKCIRTGDIDEVGDEVHHTFFEMLGNWSLGDYWKEEAIKYSYDFLTKELKIPKEKLSVTVFKGDKKVHEDNESKDIWKSLGINKITSLGKEDNWWGPAGQTGPCGPDTEMFVNNIEIWNDVFMEYNKDEKGNYKPLKQKNVDTGMGVERTLAILNGVKDNYMTEVWKPIIEEIEKLSGKKYPGNEKTMRIIADHIKASVFILAEDIKPSNTEQGYVLRRLIRRAIVYGKQLGIKNISEVSSPVFEIYKDYPKLKNKKDILNNLNKEKEQFEKTLEKGLNFFNLLYKKEYLEIDGTGKEKREDMISLSPKNIFKLYQSYGFPIEMTLDMLKEKGATKKTIKNLQRLVQKELQKHQELSRTASKGRFKAGLADSSEQTKKLHTATHLLHEALRQVLGKHVKQMGSNITPERLRFDFSHPEKMTKEQIKKVENLVNKEIKKSLPIKCEEMPYSKAKNKALSFFKDRYPKIIKVYSVGNFSKEICTGPHVKNTKELGKFKIIKEESSSAGVRRIKAVLE